MSNKIELELYFMKIGRKIKELRIQKGLSQAQLGKLVGLDARRICYYEKEKFLPNIKVLPKLANTLCVTTDYLLFDDKDKIKIWEQLPDPDLYEQFQRVDKMPEEEKKMIKQIINSMIVKSNIKQMIS